MQREEIKALIVALLCVLTWMIGFMIADYDNTEPVENTAIKFDEVINDHHKQRTDEEWVEI